MMNMKVSLLKIFLFSAGVHPDKGMIGKINSEVDEKFVNSDQLRNRNRRVCDLAGRNVLFEYACSDDSIIGQKAEQSSAV